MSKNEISIYKKLELTTTVTPNLMVKDINEKLNKEHREIIIASNCYLKIKDMELEIITSGKFKGFEVRQFEIRQHINRAILDSGYGTSLTKEDIQDIISAVIKDILTDFSTLTTQEVGIAFKNGCREAYGTYMGISARIFYTWLRQYTNVSKMEANKALAKIDKSELIITEEEKLKRHHTWLNYFYDRFNKFCETNIYDLYDSHNLFYDYLKSLKLIGTINKKEKEKVAIMARRKVKLRYQTTEVKSQFHEQEMRKMIEKITKKDKSVEFEVLGEAKNIILKQYLTDLKTKKIDLKIVIEQKKSN